ncbi:hypothetical protein FF1_034607 [Malus domestica]
MYTTRLEVGAFVDIEISVPEESRKPSSFFVHRSSKIKPRRPLKKVFFVHRSSEIKPLTALWINNHPPIQDQAPTALEESLLRSSFIVLPRSSPQRPFGSTIIHQFKIKPRRPLKKVFFVLCSSFFQDQAPTALWINHPPIQDQASTALEESTIVHHPFIQDQAPTPLWINNVDKSTHPTVLQDQAQKPLKIRSSLFFKIKPKSPWRSVHHCSSKIKPKSPFKDPLKSTFKIKSTALEERIFRVHSHAETCRVPCAGFYV